MVMPISMRLHVRSEYPVEETPPSTRPSSAASSAPSTAGTPHRSASMDSINTSFSAGGEKPVVGEEIIATRMLTTAPKINATAMQYVKTGPANLHRSAKDQMKKAQVVKSLRFTEQEEEWQSQQKRTNEKFEESSDWQSNLDKWKSSRRKKNENILERVIEVKLNENEISNTRRKSKTFSEMREETGKKGRRYNLVVHNDDNNDLSDLGLGGTTKGGNDEMKEETPEEPKDDSKDAKSDAGFCTGSDTGSDGLFPDDNASDTSSAVEDKKDILAPMQESTSEFTRNHTSNYTPITTSDYKSHTSAITDYKQTKTSDYTQLTSSTSKYARSPAPPKYTEEDTTEYTYDKAIEDYKQYAKKRVTTSLSSSSTKEKPRESSTIEDKLAFLSEQQPKFIRRHKLPKVDLDKRRSMFELRHVGTDNESSTKVTVKKSSDTGSELKSRVMSFENIHHKTDDKKRAVTVPRDTNFKQKLATFTHDSSDSSSAVRKKTPERDRDFYKKLRGFTELELNDRTSSPPSQSGEIKKNFVLRDRITSFENLTPQNALLPSSITYSTMKNSTSYHNLYSEDRAVSRSESSTLDSSTSLRNLESNQFDISHSFRDVKNASQYSTLDSSTSFTDNYTRDALESSSAENSTNAFSTQIQTSFNNISPTGFENSDRTANVDPSATISDTSLKNSENESSLGNSSSFQNSSSSKVSPVDSSPSLPSKSSSAKNSQAIEQVLTGEQFSRSTTNSRNFVADAAFESSVTRGATRTKFDIEKEAPTKISAAMPIFEASVKRDSPPLGAPPSPPKCPPPPLNVEKEIQAIEECVRRAIDSDYEGDQEQQVQYEALSSANTGEPTYAGENVYERINEPVYENIYEKVSHDQVEHQYQTLQEIKTQNTVSPALPPKNPPSAIEVIVDATWTNSSGALPPSVPPPPPPPQDDDEPLQEKFTPPIDDSKNVLRQKMSDFLGLQPQKQEAVTMLPPPDVNLMLRHEREEERLIVQKQQTMARESPLFDSLIPQPYHTKYTWDDRIKADSGQDQSNSDLDFHTQLGELEQEMGNHDRKVLQSLKESARPTLPPKLSAYASNIPPPAQYCERQTENHRYNPIQYHDSLEPVETTTVPFKEFYTAPQPIVPPTNVEENIYYNDKPPNTHNGSGADVVPNSRTNGNSMKSVDRRIARRKPDSSKKDYNKHWLIQEAEQRRLEQQNQISRQNCEGTTKFSNQSSESHFHKIKSNFNSTTAEPILHPNHNAATDATVITPHETTKWNAAAAAQTKTYQPDVAPAPQKKPLPEAIINTLTQRVKNKTNLSNGNDDNFHDYMNTGSQDAANEDQRLLSVSGKKKCSHCAEELGRGAAMIIESLRLFYHIPCFKCCVCGIQLGNGTSGADVRVRNHKLHCHNCYSNDEGMKFSKV